MAGFTYNYKPMDYKTAQGQVAGQIDPLYNRAIQGVNQQKYQNDVQAGQVAAARGLGHSGLAADQLNKIAIAAQGQVGDLNAQRATQMAQMSNDLMWRDKEYALQDRSQKYSEFNSDRGFNYQTGRDKIADTRYTDETKYNRGRDTIADNRYADETKYNRGRDTIADSRYKTEWNYNVGRDKLADTRYTNETNYSHGRDKISDQRYAAETKYSHGRDKVDDAWRQKEWSTMSPAEKARMALQYSYSKKASGGGGGGGGRRSSGGSKSSGSSRSNSKSTKSNKKTGGSTAQSNLDRYYTNPGIQAAEKAKKTNRDARQYLKDPTPPAQSPYLSAWEKKKMLGL